MIKSLLYGISGILGVSSFFFSFELKAQKQDRIPREKLDRIKYLNLNLPLVSFGYVIHSLIVLSILSTLLLFLKIPTSPTTFQKILLPVLAIVVGLGGIVIVSKGIQKIFIGLNLVEKPIIKDPLS